jgi:hypothetical protein
VRERTLPTRVRTLGSAGAQEFSSIKMPTGASAWIGLVFFLHWFNTTNMIEHFIRHYEYENIDLNFDIYVNIG